MPQETPSERHEREPPIFAPLALVGMLVALVAASPRVARADDLKEGRSSSRPASSTRRRSRSRRRDPGFAEGRAGVGQVQLKRRQYGKAMESFQTAQKMDAGLAVAYWVRRGAAPPGEVLRGAAMLQRATELDRKFPEAQLAYGDCLVKTKAARQGGRGAVRGPQVGAQWRPGSWWRSATPRWSATRCVTPESTSRAPAKRRPPTPRRGERSGTSTSSAARSSGRAGVRASLAMDTSDVELRYGLGRAGVRRALQGSARPDREVVGGSRTIRRASSRSATCCIAPAWATEGRESYASEAARAREVRPAETGRPRGFSLLGGRWPCSARRTRPWMRSTRRSSSATRQGDVHGPGEARDRAQEYDKALADYARGDPSPRINCGSPSAGDAAGAVAGRGRLPRRVDLQRRVIARIPRPPAPGSP